MNGEKLVQALIDGARRANAQVETGPINPGEFFKTAGAEQALADLDLSETEKTAIWGKVIKPALGAAWKHTGGKVVGATAKPMQWAGGKVTDFATKHLGPKWGARVGSLGRGAGREAAGFGLLSGGLGAATAEPGDRLEAFGRGFAGGALGGAAWRVGGNLTKRMLFTPKAMKSLGRAGRPGWFGGFRGEGGSVGRGFKSMGAKMLTSGVPFAGALGASMMMPMFEKEPQQQQQMYQQRYPQQYNRAGPVAYGYQRPAGY